MSAVDESSRVAGRAGKDTHSQSRVGGVHPAPALPDKVLAQLRTGGLVPPRAPGPGQVWLPRGEAETHLLGEGRRLDRVRQVLLAEVGRLRHQLKAARGDGRGRREEAARTAARQADCPLTASLLNALAAAARGETAEETAGRLHLAYDTVKNHRQRAVHRLQARSVTHAVALAVAAGWITPEQIDGGDGL
ncbi:LuxR C-terminal-related transcriptional regulator [Streptomyces adelaidensis]|uniref:LuxR C-terminal-related transcriptional regulator n=1 Tax=Streptomyces adelaidensis TaxID=2796465 RepID=UPI001908A17B|nr:LuxR C-terminal-related transcriptional regulator [Streptomyces adelaidensis]